MACPTCGSCAGMYTANTMNCLTEALGLGLPGNGTVPAVFSERIRLAKKAGMQIMEVLKADVRPKDILTREAFENAVAMDMALGGSSNTALHLPAIAHEAGIKLTLEDFNEIAKIIDGVTLNEKLTVTFDTCHVFEGGYDIVNNLDEVLTEFDKIVGLDRIQVLHINDSKNTLGAHKDRHENIGYGGIGFEAINRIVHLQEFTNIPKILETPWYGENKDIAPYKDEIAMLRRGEFIDFKK